MNTHLGNLSKRLNYLEHLSYFTIKLKNKTIDYGLFECSCLSCLSCSIFKSSIYIQCCLTFMFAWCLIQIFPLAGICPLRLSSSF